MMNKVKKSSSKTKGGKGLPSGRAPFVKKLSKKKIIKIVPKADTNEADSWTPDTKKGVERLSRYNDKMKKKKK